MNEKDISNNLISFSLNKDVNNIMISLNNIIPTISYEITQTPPPKNWVHIHSTAMITGITAAAITYSTVKATGTVASTAAEYSTIALGSIITEGVRAVLGDIPAAISNSATRTSAYIVSNSISTASSTGAIIAGATAGAITTGIVLASGFILDSIHSSINSALQYFTVSSQSQSQYNSTNDMNFIVYDLSNNNVLCFEEIEEVPKSTEQIINYGRNIRETPTLDRIQMDGKNTNSIDDSTITDAATAATTATNNRKKGK